MTVFVVLSTTCQLGYKTCVVRLQCRLLLVFIPYDKTYVYLLSLVACTQDLYDEDVVAVSTHLRPLEEVQDRCDMVRQE